MNSKDNSKINSQDHSTRVSSDEESHSS